MITENKSRRVAEARRPSGRIETPAKASPKQTKASEIAFFKEQLGTDERWAVRGLVRLYQEQTPQEKSYEVAAYDNGLGFSGVDAEILTSFAKQYQRKGSLSPKQLALLKKKMPKYAGQLQRLKK